MKMKEDTIAKGLLNFNHFIQVDNYNVNRGDLANFARRRAAVVCKRNTRGVDLIIPIIMDKSYGSVVGATTFKRPRNDKRDDSMILNVANLRYIESDYSHKLRLLDVIDVYEQMDIFPEKRPRHAKDSENVLKKVLEYNDVLVVLILLCMHVGLGRVKSNRV